MAAVAPGAQIGQPQFADLQSTTPQWPDAEPELSLQASGPRQKKKAKAKAGKKAALRYDTRGHRVRQKGRQSKIEKAPDLDEAPAEGDAAKVSDEDQAKPSQDQSEQPEAPQPPPARSRVPFAPAPRPRGRPTQPSAMLAMARPEKIWAKRPEKLEPLKKDVQPTTAEAAIQAQVESQEKLLHFDEVIARGPPSRATSLSRLSSPSSVGLVRSASQGHMSPLRRDIPVPKALNPNSFQRRTRPMDASSALRQLQEKIQGNRGSEENKKVQLESLALRDLRADLSHMLRRSSKSMPRLPSSDFVPRSVDDVFGSQPVRRRPSDGISVKLLREASSSALETHLEVDELDDEGSRPSTSSSLFPASPTASVSLPSPVTSPSVTSAKSAMRKGLTRQLREGVSFDHLATEEGEQGTSSKDSNALMMSAMNKRVAAPGEASTSSRAGRGGGRSYTLKEMANTESILRARLVDAFNRLADAKELHRDVLPQALGLVGWAMTKEIRRLVDEAYNSLFAFNTINQNEFMQFFSKFRQLEKQRAKEAFTAYDADHSGSIDFDELGALFESQGIFPLQHVIYELAMEACDGCLEDGLDFSAFHRVLEILRERQGFTREERTYFEDVFDKCDSDGSGSLDTLEIGRVLVSLGYSREMDYEQILAEVDIRKKNQLNKQDFLVFMRKIRERDTEHIRNYFRECDTDNEPGLDAREIAALIQSLGYLPDMSCILETLKQLDIDDPEKDLDFEEVWRFLEIYRRQSGLTLDAVAEAKDTFKKFTDDVAVSVDMMYQMVHSMGFDLHYHEVRKLMYLVEGNASGAMNEQEFVRAIGQLKDTELRQMWKVVHATPGSDAASQLKKQFEAEMCGTDMAEVSLMDFIPWATRVRNAQREQVRNQHGFGKDEVESFRRDFDEYSHGSTMRPLDLRRLLTEKFPMMADKSAMKDHRAKLSEILADKGPVKLLEFLALARICTDIIEVDKLKRERAAIEITSFSSAEVDEFRGLFMEHSTDSGLPGSFRSSLTFRELKKLLENVIPLGDGNIQVLKTHLRMVQKRPADDTADFVEFLHLMRRLLDLNFAGIAELSKNRTSSDGKDLS